MIIDIVPFPNASPQAIAPNLLIAAVFFWCLHRPDLLGNASCFFLGLLYDAAAGLPIGMMSILLLIERAMIMTPNRFLVAKSFGVVWICFGLVALTVDSLRWFFLSLWYLRVFAFEPVFLGILLTVLFYPLIAWIFSHVHSALPHPPELTEQ